MVYTKDYLLSVVVNPRENMLELVKDCGFTGSLRQIERQAVEKAKELIAERTGGR